MIESINDLRLFSSVARNGSMTKAGQELDVSPATISKRITRLEADLGTRLLNRTTRACSMTHEGLEFYERCQVILSYVEETQTALTNSNSNPQGVVRLSVPASFGRLYGVRLISEFLEMYPQMSVKLHFSDDVVDVVHDAFDVVVRFAELSDSTLVAKRIGEDRLVVVATPDYLASHGVPLSPSDLQDHNCLVQSNPAPHRRWPFRDTGGKEYVVAVSGNLESNNGEAILSALLQGIGITVRPLWEVQEHINTGRVREVLEEYKLAPVPIYVAYPSARQLSPKVRAFVDFVADRLSPEKDWHSSL